MLKVPGLSYDDDDEKRYLFTTQIIEHTAYSLLIRTKSQNCT